MPKKLTNHDRLMCQLALKLHLTLAEVEQLTERELHTWLLFFEEENAESQDEQTPTDGEIDDDILNQLEQNAKGSFFHE